MSIDNIKVISEELSLNENGVRKAIELLSEGNTVPFIARYRKEQTGSLTDENLRNIEERIIYLNSLADRKKTVFKSLEEQGIKDEKLLSRIDNSLLLSEVEDLYRPYKPKRETRASKARKAGLEPLSKYILEDRTGNLEKEAPKYICDKYETAQKCIQGAMDIIAEDMSDNANFRTYIKGIALKRGIVESEKTKDASKDTYDNYMQYQRPVPYLKGYNVLAINRGVKEKCLARKLVLPDEEIMNHLYTFTFSKNTPYSELSREITEDSYKRLIFPSIENEIFSYLMDNASDEAIVQFKASLRATLLFPPITPRKVMGFDPGFAHGCKLAFVDQYSKVIYTYVLSNPFGNEKMRENATIKLKDLIIKFDTWTVALGNGHAGRESEELLKEIKKDPRFEKLEIVIVSESGASIYSATELAQKEFPQYEPNIRSAISIARRLQDPLAELVKIPPMSIGVGQYQHDIDEKKMERALTSVVEDVVNYVGVNLNTASFSLLSYVSGISMKIAQSIVSYREKNGYFTSRESLKKVPGLGPKAFENCAGFLRVPESKEYLDNTSVHPESYPIAEKIVQKFGQGDVRKCSEILPSLKDEDIESLSRDLDVGLDTLTDIVKELIKPSRDPRMEVRTAKLRDDVKTLDDLKVGMILEGTIRNVAGFGFFVDIGVEQDGLVHISEIADRRIEDPHQYGKIGDVVKVKVKEVDLKRKRISLSMKGIEKTKL